MSFYTYSNQGSNIAWIKAVCAIDTTELSTWGIIQISVDADNVESLRLNSDLWMMEFYLTVREGLEDGTKGTIRTEFDLWQMSANPTTGVAPDKRKLGNVWSLPAPLSEDEWHYVNRNNCASMADQYNSIQAFLYDDLYHEFTIGENPRRIATFNVDGEAYGEETLHLPGSSINAPETPPAKQGYIFLGWALDGTTDVLTFPQTMGSTNVVYSAMFEALPTHTATFMVDDAFYDDVITYEGAAITVPDDPIKTGYSFTGWNPTVGVMGTADMVFNATFSANTYSVNFYKETTDSTPYQTLSVLFDGTYNIPATPTKTGYIFSGWVDANGNSMPATHTTDADVAFYALWTAGSYNSEFDANGGQFSDGTTKKVVSTDFDSEIAPPSEPSKLGYNFAGWAPDVGIMDDVNGKEFSAIWIARNDTKYTLETYTMNPEGEYDKVAVVLNGTTDESITLSPSVSKGFTLNTQKSILQGIISADNSLVLKVYLDRNKYSFSTVVDGVSESSDYLYGSMISEPAIPSKTGYTFTGWSSEIPETMPANDVTVEAEWQVNTYTVTWITDGTETKTTVTYGAKIETPATPVKAGYEFIGWDNQVPETMPANDLSFTAQFECITTVSIKNNPGTKTIKYGETLKLTAITANMPSDAKINWYVDGVKKGEGETFEVSPKNGNIEITVKIVDSNGNVLKDKNGNEIQDSEKVSVNSGLWQKIVSFFKNLFGINRTVVQAIFKGII